MKSIVRIILLSLSMLLFTVTALSAENAVVEKVSGKVELQKNGGSWEALSAGDEIPLGATISTGFRSEALLQIGAATLEVKQLTRMRLDELIQKEGVVKTDLFLRVGRVRTEVKHTEGLQQDFRLRSPVSTAAVRGTSFSFDGSNLQVFTGLVALTNTLNQVARVAAGENSSTDGFSLPPEGVEALEQMFNVSINTSQIEEQLESLLPSLDLTSTGSVTINWTYSSPQ
jgi:hypothetical protein